MIKKVTQYETLGQTFSTWEAAVEYRENAVGNYLDKLDYVFRDLSPKTRLIIVERIIASRKELIRLLDYNEVEPEGEE